MTSTGVVPLTLAIPVAVHKKLTEIAGYQSPETWARHTLIRAMEEAQPDLRTSGLWHMHISAWHDGDEEQ